jgi:hypothetical protein
VLRKASCAIAKSRLQPISPNYLRIVIVGTEAIATILTAHGETVFSLAGVKSKQAHGVPTASLPLGHVPPASLWMTSLQ